MSSGKRVRIGVHLAQTPVGGEQRRQRRRDEQVDRHATRHQHACRQIHDGGADHRRGVDPEERRHVLRHLLDAPARLSVGAQRQLAKGHLAQATHAPGQRLFGELAIQRVGDGVGERQRADRIAPAAEHHAAFR